MNSRLTNNIMDNENVSKETKIKINELLKENSFNFIEN